MSLIKRIGQIWTSSPEEEALNMLSDWQFDYGHHIDQDDFDTLIYQVESGLYEDAFYFVQDAFYFLSESELILFLRLLEEASNV